MAKKKKRFELLPQVILAVLALVIGLGATYLLNRKAINQDPPQFLDQSLPPMTLLEYQGKDMVVGDLVKALNALGVTPKDLITILQSIKAADV